MNNINNINLFNKAHLRMSDKITTDGSSIIRNLQKSFRAFSRKTLIKKIYG